MTKTNFINLELGAHYLSSMPVIWDYSFLGVDPVTVLEQGSKFKFSGVTVDDDGEYQLQIEVGQEGKDDPDWYELTLKQFLALSLVGQQIAIASGAADAIVDDRPRVVVIKIPEIQTADASVSILSSIILPISRPGAL